MEAKEIVIDTNIWVKALVNTEFDPVCSLALIQFMGNENHVLAVDYAGEILKEYSDNLRGERPYQMWKKRLEGQNRIFREPSDINRRFDARLYELGFHEPEDHVFVGVAIHADKMIITEDSDYGVHGEPETQQVFTYMRDTMGLQVVTAESFVKMGK